MKKFTFTDILNNEEGRSIINQLEEAEAEIRDRGIDKDDDTEFYARLRKMLIKDLKKQFKYNWE